MDNQNKKNKGLTLEDFASPLAAKNHFIKASFGGFAGSGKTRTASEFIAGCYADLKIEKPLLIIDNEKGSRFLVKFFEDKGVKTYVKETVQLADIIGAFTLLNEGQIGFLFIDSLSKVWYQYVRDYRALNKRTFMTLQDWGKILPAWQEMFSDRFVDLNGNCVFTGRGGYTYDMEENSETGKKEFAKSGVKMKLAGETPFEPDLNCWMELNQELKDGKPVVWRDCQIMKDRSGLIDGKTFKNPTYKNFQPVVKYLVNVPIGEVAGETNTENTAPAENYAGVRDREEREILVSEVQGIFELHGLSGSLSADKKQLKAHILTAVFGTTSPERLQKLSSAELLNGKAELNKVFASLVDVEPEHKIEWLKKHAASKQFTVEEIIS